jgi:hypothetical protein
MGSRRHSFVFPTIRRRPRGFEKTPQRHKDSGSSDRDMVVVLIYVFMQPFNSARSVFGIYRSAVSLVALDIC